MPKLKSKVRKKGKKKDRKGIRKKPKVCRFCVEKLTVDYKDFGVLSKLLTKQGRLFSRKRSGNCAKHQRKVANAVKRARFMALLPYTMIGRGAKQKR